MRPTKPRAKRAVLDADSRRTDALGVFALASFAIAQPLYDLLGRNPTFFVYRRWQAGDFFVFVLLLSVVLPLVLVAAAELSGSLGRSVRRACYALVTGLLASLLALPLITRVAGLSAWATVALALLAGGILALAYTRRPRLRQFLSLLAVPSLLLFATVFLLRDGIRQQWLGTTRDQTAAASAPAGPPIAILVLDALPTSSLLDDRQGIDPVRYPAFARLAAESTWYRRATTVAESTEEAVPSILTGRCPRAGEAPLFASQPRNLFTLLGSGYGFEVSESVTRLCPEDLCGSEDRPSFGRRFLPLLSDSVIVFLHGALPAEWTVRLPPIDQGWGDFRTKAVDLEWHQRGGKDVQVEDYRQLLSALRRTERPNLLFSHLVLPHSPYRFLPSGQVYRNRERISQPAWKAFRGDLWVSRHSYQRHLLQLGFADTLLGELLDRLRELDLYDETLIIVTADHGISFWSGEPRRTLSETNAADILSVPLFVKRPGQQVAAVSDEPVQIVDILPLVAEVLEEPPPEWADGRPPGRIGDTVHSCPQVRDVSTPVLAMEEIRRAAERKIELFGTGATAGSFPRVGPHLELIGSDVREVSCPEAASLEVDLRDASLFADVDPESAFVPAEIVGAARITDSRAEADLAVAVNGVVRATTTTYRHGVGDTNLWTAIVPETAFRRGRNDIAVFDIRTGSGRCRLLPSTGLSSPLSFLGLRLGVSPVPYVTDTGFRRTDVFDEKVRRWTGGLGMIRVPMSATEASRVRRLRVDLASSGKKGTRLKVILNKVTLFDQRIEPGPWSKTFDVDPPASGRPVVVKLESGTFSRKGKAFGVSVEGIWLLPEFADAAPTDESAVMETR